MSKLTWSIWTDNENRLIHSAASCCVYNDHHHMEYKLTPVRVDGKQKWEYVGDAELVGADDEHKQFDSLREAKTWCTEQEAEWRVEAEKKANLAASLS